MVRGTTMAPICIAAEAKDGKIRNWTNTSLLAAAALPSTPSWALDAFESFERVDAPNGINLSYRLQDGISTLVGEIKMPTSDDICKRVSLDHVLQNGKVNFEFKIPDSEAEKKLLDENKLKIGQLTINDKSKDVKVSLHETKDKSSASLQLAIVADQDTKEGVNVSVNNQGITRTPHDFLDTAKPTEIVFQSDSNNNLFIGCRGTEDMIPDKDHCHAIGYGKYLIGTMTRTSNIVKASDEIKPVDVENNINMEAELNGNNDQDELYQIHGDENFEVSSSEVAEL